MATIDRECLGQDFHTALRKCCDSPATSLAWNLINRDELSDIWSLYLDMVISQHETNATAQKDPNRLLWQTAQQAAGALEPRGIEDYTRRGWVTILRLTFELFDERDWKGMIAFVNPDEED